jgi:lipid A ethanolaminephosphotransferase
MSLKLFRHTGFHSILAPGETRVALHPGWMLLAAVLWLGFACNVWLWQALLRGESALRPALLGVQVAAAAGLVLNLLGWRRTFKLATTLLLLLGALLAGGAWVQQLPLEAALQDGALARMLPPWAALMRWQVPAFVAVLWLLPCLWVWNAQLRRLAGPVQLRKNLLGMLLSAAVLAAVHWLLPRLPG